MKTFTKIMTAGIIASVVSSCSVNTDTTYYNDASSSMQSNILMDKSMLGMANMLNESPNGKANMPDLSKLSTDWKSLYDIQKESVVNLNEDSVKVLKKLFMKVNKDQNEIVGLSVKYDRLQPQEIVQLFSRSRQLRNIPLQNAAKWNGKTLTIDTGKFNVSPLLDNIDQIENQETSAPKTKADSVAVYGKQVASGVAGMLRMVNMNITSTVHFQKPIKTIIGKHDFVKQLDSKTVQINVRTKDLLDGGKKLKDKDEKIVIITE